MGGQGLRRSFETLYPSAFANLYEAQEAEHVIVELNPLVHNVDVACSAAFEADDDEGVIAGVLGQLQWLITEVCAPTVTLHLVADGVAPVAKRNVQFDRRTRYHADHQRTGCWNRCKATPGTFFMVRLRKAVEEWLSRTRPCPSCQVSLDDTPGEGEVKVAHALRVISDKRRTADEQPVVCVMGCDADLIVTALTAAAGRGLLKTVCLDSLKRPARVGSVAEIVRVAALPRVLSGGFDAALDLAVCSLCAGGDCLPALLGVTTQAMLESFSRKPRALAVVGEGGRVCIDPRGLSDVLARAVGSSKQKRKGGARAAQQTGSVSRWLEGVAWELTTLYTGSCCSWTWQYCGDGAPTAAQVVQWARGADRELVGPPEGSDPPPSLREAAGAVLPSGAASLFQWSGREAVPRAAEGPPPRPGPASPGIAEALGRPLQPPFGIGQVWEAHPPCGDSG
eukprot:Hpha_TRINITY_DN33724_c0_g1::TRINITY_DN33724_c0_g1_i1::g.25166::m.25166